MNNSETLFLIGEFASMNKVSTRMLRHYDKINILHPHMITDNGYRYYSEQQISIISKIKMLRDCDFSLEEIAQTLANDSDTFFMEQVEHKIIELNQQLNLHQNAMERLKNFCKLDCHTDFVNQYGISLIQREERTLLISNQSFDLEHIEEEFDKLFSFLDKAHLIANGCAVLQSRFDEKEASKAQVGVPVTKPFQNKQYSTLILPRSKYISTIHYGDYYNMGYAYNCIMKYAELKGHSIAPCFTEQYFIDSSHTTNRNQYVTEVSVSINNNSA